MFNTINIWHHRSVHILLKIMSFGVFKFWLLWWKRWTLDTYYYCTHRGLKDPLWLGLEKAINITAYVYMYGGVLRCILVVLCGFQLHRVIGTVRPFSSHSAFLVTGRLIFDCMSFFGSDFYFMCFYVTVDARATWFTLTWAGVPGVQSFV